MSTVRTVTVGAVLIGGADAITSSASSPTPINIVSNAGQTVHGLASLAGPAATIVTAPTAMLLTGLKITSDLDAGLEVSPGDIVTLAGNAVAIVLAVSAGPMTAAAVGLGIAMTSALLNTPQGQQAIDAVKELLLPGTATERLLIDIVVNNNWNTARTPTRRDPLAIDLDRDGIETLGIPASGSPVLFDHNGDGVRTGTGWLRPDDAWLVRDLDGNGSIDAGRELFGVDTAISVTELVGSTVVTGTRNARTGFEALRALDDNRDNSFTAADAAWSQVQLWRDLNGDGISQAAELSTLASHGIIGIGLNEITSTTDLGNGNRVTGTAVVRRASGPDATVSGVDLTASNLDLADNPFYREFADTIPLTPAAAASPTMGGSGWLRDLREAASLGSSAAGELQATINAFAAASSRTEQLALVSQLLEDWADTSGRRVFSTTRMVDGETISETSTHRTIRYVGSDREYSATGAGSYVSLNLVPDSYTEPFVQSGVPSRRPNAAGVEVLRRLSVLEAFNGSRFIDFTRTVSKGGTGLASGTGGGSGSSGAVVPGPTYIGRVDLQIEQIQALNRAYTALGDSVYGALALQTRLRPYLDAVQLVLDDTGVRFDASPLQALLTARHAASPQVALEDLSELVRFAMPSLHAVGFDAVAQLRGWVEALAPDSALRSLLPGLLVTAGPSLQAADGPQIWLGDASPNAVDGGGGNDVLDGGAGNDIIRGSAGEDFLFGRAGDDHLLGGTESDLLDGGAGNDVLDGGLGDDRYGFGRGSGVDTIANVRDDSPSRSGTLRLGPGVMPADVRLRQVHSAFWTWRADVELSIVGTGDRITMGGMWRDLSGYSEGWADVQRIEFEDGTVWDGAQLRAMLLAGTPQSDAIFGTLGADQIDTLEGDDQVWGSDGDDQLRGGLGQDTLAGDAGNDQIWGEGGHDNLQGGDGHDMLHGGLGNDTLDGGRGNNIYRFERGDGQDTIAGVLDTNPGKTSVLELGPGIAPADLLVRPVHSTFWGWSADLRLSLLGTADAVTVGALWRGISGGPADYTPVHAVRFADGTIWGAAELRLAATTGTSAADVLVGTSGADTLTGLAGNDTLSGGDGADTLLGGDGADSLNGDAGHDVLDGGTGNDSLNGGAGNNIYRFARGGGQDTIASVLDNTTGKSSVLELGPGIAPTDLLVRSVHSSFWGWSADLRLSILGSSDTITVGALWRGISGGAVDYTPVQAVRFADGTVWGANDLRAAALTGTAGADTLTGTSLADVITGLAGNDHLSGGAGNDTLSGGAGNDTLDGGTGNNTYLFGRGGGADTVTNFLDNTAGKDSVLKFAPGIAPADIRARTVYSSFWGWNADVEFSIAGTTDRITVGALWRQSLGSGGSYTQVQRVEFDDGTVWRTPEIIAAVNRGAAPASAGASDGWAEAGWPSNEQAVVEQGSLQLVSWMSRQSVAGPLLDGHWSGERVRHPELLLVAQP